MKLLLDQGLPRSTVKHLAAAGILTEHVGDLDMASASDAAILNAARQRQAVVVAYSRRDAGFSTVFRARNGFDADFHELFSAAPASEVRIRMEGLKGNELAAILVNVIAVAGAELAAGAVVSVTKQRIRVRSLPIGR